MQCKRLSIQKDTCYPPIRADLSVSAFRRWKRVFREQPDGGWIDVIYRKGVQRYFFQFRHSYYPGASVWVCSAKDGMS